MTDPTDPRPSIPVRITRYDAEQSRHLKNLIDDVQRARRERDEARAELARRDTTTAALLQRCEQIDDTTWTADGSRGGSISTNEVCWCGRYVAALAGPADDTTRGDRS